jgi:pilus assembly protein CpaF
MHEFRATPILLRQDHRKKETVCVVSLDTVVGKRTILVMKEVGPVIVQLPDRLAPASTLGYLEALGPIRPLVEDDRLTEIMVVGPDAVYVEMDGRILRTDICFAGEDQLLDVINVIVTAVGRRIDSESPIVDARLLDGSRVAASIPPVTLSGPLLTIRKFSRKPFQVDDLVRFGTLTADGAALLQAAVLARCNIIISGGTGTGKTTLLNVCSGFIPGDERIVTIEDAAELRLRQEHVCSMEARQPGLDGSGRIAIRDLVIHSLRMRPDRIVVGECRGGEALDMLQAMNTGHDGSMTTVHSNSPRDCLSRLETLVLMSGMELPVRAIRQQIASAIDIVLQLERMRDGSRRVTAITEVVGMEGDTITMQDIFTFEAQGVDADGRIAGSFAPTGVRPMLLQRLTEMGVPVPAVVQRTFPGAAAPARRR